MLCYLQEMHQAAGTATLSVMLISQSFIGKPWPMRELLEILARPDQALPVLYLMSHETFKSKVPAQTKVRYPSVAGVCRACTLMAALSVLFCMCACEQCTCERCCTCKLTCWLSNA